LNKRFSEVFGYTLEDIPTGRDWFHKAYPDPDYRRKAISAWKGDLRQSAALELRIREFRVVCKDGTPRDIIFRPVSMGDRQQFVTYEDLTERKQAEAALRESEEKYRNVVERANDGIVIVQDGLLKYVNPQLAEIAGYAIEELTDSLFVNYIDPGQRARVSEYHKRRMAGEKAPARYESALRNKNGTKIDVEFNVGTVEYEGKPAALAMVRDITERKLAEQALQEKEAELRIKAKNLEEVNTALRVLLERREKDKGELEEKVLSNVKDLVFPYLERLQKTSLDANQMSFVNILESNLNDIVSPFSRRLSSKYLSLTPTEIRVSNLIKHGKTTKEIAEFMNLSGKTIEFHRDNVRKKLGLRNKKVNLRTHLLSI
jgi:PAS domain S-box-containing protein